jgi:hypothetical protein
MGTVGAYILAKEPSEAHTAAPPARAAVSMAVDYIPADCRL